VTRRADADTAAILNALCRDPHARLIACENGHFSVRGPGGRRLRQVSRRQIQKLVASGLLAKIEGGLAATPAAAAWLRRLSNTDGSAFRTQHDEFARIGVASGGGATLANLDESPVATLARRSGRSGEPWLSPHAVAAAERLRRDFEVGQLQPRVTANWSASVSDGRRTGDHSGVTDLTDMALAARQRFDRAMQVVGPELCGVLADVCCFLKGLETVERERQWPARSAKLVLRLALERLASHYGLLPVATGRSGSGDMRHWGADDYRPEIS
jgi:hypothetical protein